MASTLRKAIWVIAVLGLLMACRQSGAGPEQQDSTPMPPLPEPVSFDLEMIKKRGKMIALVDNSSTGYFIYKGQPMGYEYDLLKRFSNSIGVALELIIVSDIQEAFTKLDEGQADIIAYNLTVTKSRKERVAFSEPIMQARQMLIQRKPENWRKLKRHQIEKQLIRNPVNLAGTEVYARKNSAYVERLKNLSEEIGADIAIVEDFGNVETELLIRKVANGEIDYTVADENIALINAGYYPNIDVKTAISFPQQIAWAVRRNAPELQQAANTWIKGMKKKSEYYVIYNKYFKSARRAKVRAASTYSSSKLGGGAISPYDALIQNAAERIEWDWRLLAAQIYQESNFEAYSESWTGAKGLMQLMPATAAKYNVSNYYDPQQNIGAGVKYLQWLTKLWTEKVPNEQERIKFILASYNVGVGHVLDARRLARKYGKDPEQWEGHVAYFLERKNRPRYYKDEASQMGYCRGEEPVKYVKEIMERYTIYQQLLPETDQDSTLQENTVNTTALQTAP